MTIRTVLEKPLFVILLIWIFLTAININKPFQGDDCFHLEAARHIIKDPLHPMSGMIRWDRPEPEPMYKANQPPLLFYMIAGVALVAGFNEVPMHILISVFSFFALFWFYRLAKLYAAPKPLLLLALLGLCPAFVVNQNVMTDIPLLALLLGLVYYFLKAEKTGHFKYNVAAVLLLTTGLFIKYIFLAVLGAAGFIFLLRKQYKNLLLLLIPLFCLILWSAWNYWEFGGAHILQRSTTPLFSRWNMLWSYFACLGSVATFGLFSLNHLLKGRLNMRIVYSLTTFFLLIIFYDYQRSQIESRGLNYALEAVSFISGVIIITSVIKIVRSSYSAAKAGTFLFSDTAFLAAIAFSLSTFFILLAPTMATRHILLVIPFLLLLSGRAFQHYYKPGLAGLSVITAFLFSLLLGISDWQFAEFYRNTAKGLKKSTPPASRIWASGAGGWQWYTQENGMMLYTPETAKVQAGDYLAIAKGIFHYRIDPNMNYSLVAQVWPKDIGPFSYFNTRDLSMYRTLFGMPAWTLSKKSADTVYVLQCTGFKDQ